MAEQIHKSGQDENVATEATYFARQIVFYHFDEIPDSKWNLLNKKQSQGAVEDDLELKNNAKAVKIGIQGFPGLKFHFQNWSTDPLIIGNTGIFEIDLTDSGGVIYFLSVERIENFIFPNPIIIDILYKQTANKTEGGGAGQ